MDRRRFLGVFVAVLGGLFMPTSNGLVTARDIRQGSVKTLHILDEAVTTPKIPDLAVTFPDKIDDPHLALAFEEAGAPSVSTTPVDFSTTIDVPAWAESVAVFAIAQLQLSNNSGSPFNAQVRCSVDGTLGSGALSVTIPNSSTASVIDFQRVNVTGAAGSTITVTATCSINSGTATFPHVHLGGMVMFSR